MSRTLELELVGLKSLQEQFWRENVGLFEERDFQILRVLLKLLESSRQPRTLAVACHDLGQFITYYPAGKGIVTGEWDSTSRIGGI